MKNLYERLVEFTGDGVFRYTVSEGRILFANRGFMKIWDLPGHPNSVKGRLLKELMIYTQKEGTVRRAIVEKGAIHEFEYHFKTLKGEDRWVIHDSFVVTDSHSGEKVIDAIVRDITHRRQAEEQVRASLAEKEALLKEVHHRVRNNLQIVLSLLHLQAGMAGDERILQTLKDCCTRVRTMALIHEKLYEARDQSKIVFGEYLEGLVAELLAAYGVAPDAVRARINVDPNLRLDIHDAIHCALIINELVSNALGHAFPDGRGEIRVDVCSPRLGQYEVVVGDNGVGFPPGLDFRKTRSLGLHLVNTLVGQLSGTIALQSKGGTEFRITFNRPALTPAGGESA